jgi:hypothetical protein
MSTVSLYKPPNPVILNQWGAPPLVRYQHCSRRRGVDMRSLTKCIPYHSFYLAYKYTTSKKYSFPAVVIAFNRFQSGYLIHFAVSIKKNWLNHVSSWPEILYLSNEGKVKKV